MADAKVRTQHVQTNHCMCWGLLGSRLPTALLLVVP